MNVENLSLAIDLSTLIFVVIVYPKVYVHGRIKRNSRMQHQYRIVFIRMNVHKNLNVFIAAIHLYAIEPSRIELPCHLLFISYFYR